MSEELENPRVFPLSINDTGDAGYEGIALRDYFAAHAPITMADAIQVRKDGGGSEYTYQQIFTTLAAMRMCYADAMLAARKP